MIQGIIRRRMFGVEGKNKYAFTREATQYTPANPNVVAALYAEGLCASPDYATIEEANGWTVSQILSIKNYRPFNEPFDGFQYCIAYEKISNDNDRYALSDIGITHIVFPPNMKLIVTDFCRGNNLVGLIEIPASVTYIGSRVFYLGGDNYYVSLLSTTPCQISSNSFNTATKVYVPDNALAVYQTTWANYTTIIEKLEPISNYNPS